MHRFVACIPEDCRGCNRAADPAVRATWAFMLSRHHSVDHGVEAGAFAVNPDENDSQLLFTSGSTEFPKDDHRNRMLVQRPCQMCLRLPQSWRGPPVPCYWLPWHHISSGGIIVSASHWLRWALYIDTATTVRAKSRRRVRNLREVARCFIRTLPKVTRAASVVCVVTARLGNFFSRVRVLQYAGASISQHIC